MIFTFGYLVNSMKLNRIAFRFNLPDIMHQDLINQIKQLVTQQPENIFFRFLLADHLLEHGALDQAQKEFQEVLNQTNDNHILSQAGLARIDFLKKSYQTCRQTLESLISIGFDDLNVRLLYARCLLKQSKLFEACQQYQNVIVLDPFFKDEELEEIQFTCV
jgi:tetratricopeptide (TPR) repeat protein